MYTNLCDIMKLSYVHAFSSICMYTDDIATRTPHIQSVSQSQPQKSIMSTSSKYIVYSKFLKSYV